MQTSLHQTRITFNVNLQKIGDEAKLTRVLRAWRPAALLAMNAYNPADGISNVGVRLQQVMAEWGGLFIYRLYEPVEARLWAHRSVEQQLNMLAHYNAPANVWFNVGNEPVGEGNGAAREADIRRGADWYAELFRRAPARGLRISGPALPVAAFQPHEVQWWDSMLQS